MQQLYGSTLSVNSWQWADKIQTPPGSGVYPGLSSGTVKVQQWTSIMDQPLTPFIMKLHRPRDTIFSPTRLQRHLPQITFIYFRIAPHNKDCFFFIFFHKTHSTSAPISITRLNVCVIVRKRVKRGSSITELRADVHPAPPTPRYSSVNKNSLLAWCLL